MPEAQQKRKKGNKHAKNIHRHERKYGRSKLVRGAAKAGKRKVYVPQSRW